MCQRHVTAKGIESKHWGKKSLEIAQNPEGVRNVIEKKISDSHLEERDIRCFTATIGKGHEEKVSTSSEQDLTNTLLNRGESGCSACCMSVRHWVSGTLGGQKRPDPLQPGLQRAVSCLLDAVNLSGVLWRAARQPHLSALNTVLLLLFNLCLH